MKQTYTIALSAALILGTAPLAWSQVVPDTNQVKWVGSASAGLTLTRGNSRTLLGTATIVDTAKWKQNELSLGADGAYGESTIDNVNKETTDQLHGYAQYNRLFTERFYGYARVDGLHDGIADIQYRLALSPGVGYYFIKNKKTDLSAEVGPGYIVEKLGHTDHDYATLRIAEKFHYAFSDRARLWQTVEFLPEVDKFDNYIINFEIGVEADLSKSQKLTLRSYFDDTYNNQPAAGRLKNDLKLVTALAYKF